MADQRQTRGKQKIEMKLIENEEDRIRIFSKRRSGIFKKTNALVTLCGAEVAFGTYSPKGKQYTFAPPSMECLENRLIEMENPVPRLNPKTPLVRANQQAKLEELNETYNELASRIEAEKEQRKAMENLLDKSAANSASSRAWWETPLDDLEYDELIQMNESLEDLQKKLCNHINGGANNSN